MPNWCNNNVSISHPDRAKIEALAEAVREGNFCKFVIPVPQDLTDTVAGFPGEDQREAHEAQQKRNLELYGAKDWYDFCTGRWGTKWDVDAYDPSEVKVDKYNDIYFGFDSAWSPPIGVYEALVEQGFEVEAMYYEPGMAYCGIWQNGHDDHYDIGGMSSDDVKDMLPEHLDDNFGISECMAEYEEQDRLNEDLYRFTKEGGEAKGLELKPNE